MSTQNTAWMCAGNLSESLPREANNVSNLESLNRLLMLTLSGSTYFLQLPSAYSIPLLITSGMIHWLISESIFLLRISTFYEGSEGAASTSSQVGYSCPPILAGVLIVLAMIFVVGWLSCRKLASSIPIAGSCSVAIAAAAHRPKDDVDAAYLPVRWGEVRREGTEEVGHCCFTSKEVHEPIPGRLYAGLLSETTETTGV